MLGLGHFALTNFTNRENMLKISNLPITVLRGASHAWIADNLPVGPTAEWIDLEGQKPFKTQYPTTQGLWPTATKRGNRSALVFESDYIDVDVSLPGPHTVAIVGKLSAAPANAALISGGSGATYSLYVGGNGKWWFSAGTGLPSNVTADTGIHIFVVVVDGANSVISIDGVEATGNAGTNAATHLRLGGAASAFYDSEIYNVQTLPWAANEVERAAIVKLLKADYNLP